MRLIDAKAMKEWIDEYLSEFMKSYNKDIEVYIDYQPSIDIVRCKECVYSYEIDTDFGALWFCKKYQYHFNADDFCSYGERGRVSK